jgi:hypothetical protein
MDSRTVSPAGIVTPSIVRSSTGNRRIAIGAGGNSLSASSTMGQKRRWII